MRSRLTLDNLVIPSEVLELVEDVRDLSVDLEDARLGRGVSKPRELARDLVEADDGGGIVVDSGDDVGARHD